jgi:hypothetical protein
VNKYLSKKYFEKIIFEQIKNWAKVLLNKKYFEQKDFERKFNWTKNIFEQKNLFKINFCLDSEF